MSCWLRPRGIEGRVDGDALGDQLEVMTGLAPALGVG